MGRESARAWIELSTVRVRRGAVTEVYERKMLCPRRDAAIALEECMRCADFGGMRVGARSWVECRTPDAVGMAAAARSCEDELGLLAEAQETPVSAIMTRDVVCVTPETGVDALEDLLVERGIDGAPVVDEAGHPIGMVSKTDLVVRARDGRSGEAPARAVDDLMTPLVMALPIDASVARAAALMAYEGVHRVPITCGGKLVGLVTAIDVLRWLGRCAGYLGETSDA